VDRCRLSSVSLNLHAFIGADFNRPDSSGGSGAPQG
jgi:hypothetical protein